MAAVLAVLRWRGSAGGGQAGAGQCDRSVRRAPVGRVDKVAVGPGGRPGFNINDMLERLPVISIADVKVGDTIIVSSTQGVDPTRLTAISLVAGADTLLAMLAPRPQAGQAPNPAAGLRWQRHFIRHRLAIAGQWSHRAQKHKYLDLCAFAFLADLTKLRRINYSGLFSHFHLRVLISALK